MRCIFGVYDLGQNEIGECLSFRECGTLRDRWSEDGHLFTSGHCHAILCVIGAGIYGSDDDKHMLEMRTYPSRAERQRTRFLKVRNNYMILYQTV